MINKGLVSTRALPKINPLRGFGPEQNGLVDTETAPVSAGVTIKSGQVISLDASGEWILGCPTGKVPYFAQQDSADGDVTSSGLLTGLSCSGDYVIETGYIEDLSTNKTANENTYALDVEVTADAANPGSIKVAGTGDAVLGKVARQAGYIDAFEDATDKKVVVIRTLYTGLLAL